MRRAAAVLAVLALVVGIRVAWGSHDAAPAAPPVVDPGPVESPAIPAGAFVAQVVRVVDGDTFLARVGAGAHAVRVRVIGIDTPETVKPDTPVRCYGPQASTFTKHLLPAGAQVRAAHEAGGDVDRYGRQLWDVWLPDGRFLESVLVASGAARAYPYPPQTDHATLLATLQDEARASGRGLWGAPCRGHSFADGGSGGRAQRV
jgi:micrococcal nuclease